MEPIQEDATKHHWLRWQLVELLQVYACNGNRYCTGSGNLSIRGIRYCAKTGDGFDIGS